MYTVNPKLYMWLLSPVLQCWSAARPPSFPAHTSRVQEFRRAHSRRVDLGRDFLQHCRGSIRSRSFASTVAGRCDESPTAPQPYSPVPPCFSDESALSLLRFRYVPVRAFPTRVARPQAIPAATRGHEGPRKVHKHRSGPALDPNWAELSHSAGLHRSHRFGGV